MRVKKPGLIKISLVLIGIAGILGGCFRDESARLAMFTGKTMGTTYMVKYVPNGEVTTDGLKVGVETILKKVDRLMSTHLPGSELSRFNASDSTDWMPVSAETATVLSEALRISALSEGAFDITVGALVNLWGFGKDSPSDHVPSERKINRLKNKSGYQKIKFRKQPPALKKLDGTLNIDLSALAKGYGVDRIADFLESRQVASYLVEVGGELRIKGEREPGKPWVIAIEKPTTTHRAVQRTVSMTHHGLATSGDYRNFFQEGEQRFSHIINPKTGRPIAHNLASVSVIDDRCMTADAWATALMVAGPVEGYEIALKNKIAAFFVYRTENGFQERLTPQFKEYLNP